MKEPNFAPKPGQVDYTNIRYAPVVNALVANGDEILLVKRSLKMKVYPGRWSTIDGYLDDQKTIEDKVVEELEEEVGIKPKDIISLKRGVPIIKETPEYEKTWLIIPVLVKVKTKQFKLNWESEDAKWFSPHAIAGQNLMAHQLQLINQFYPGTFKL